MNNPLVHIALSGGGGGGGAVTSVNGQVGDVDLTAADVGAATTLDVLRYITLTNSSTITGTTALTLIRSQLIPANTFTQGNIVTVRQRLRKTGASGIFTGGIYVNTIDSVTGASQLGIFSTGGINQLSLQMKRELFIKSATSTETMWTNTSYGNDDTNLQLSVASTNIDWTINQYIVFTCTPASATDSIIQSGYMIELL